MDLSKTIEPKSDQLNADDLVSRPTTVTVERVSAGNGEQPVNVHLVDHARPFKPCKTMRRVLISAWGDDGRDWVGKSMTIYCDPEVKYAGVKVGGIRISHLSDIERDRDFTVTVSKGKRKPITIRRLEVKDTDIYPEKKFNSALPTMLKKMASGEMTKEQIIAQCEQTGKLTDGQKSRLVLPEVKTEENEDGIFGE